MERHIIWSFSSSANILINRRVVQTAVGRLSRSVSFLRRLEGLDETDTSPYSADRLDTQSAQLLSERSRRR